jgi:hypothetical protein
MVMHQLTLTLHYTSVIL